MIPIIFGTMRMNEHSFSLLDWVDHLRFLNYHNIEWLHSSYEYNSFELLCEVLEQLKSDHNICFKHLVKLGEPDFNNNKFSSKRLIKKIELYQSKLKVNTLDAIQWMWRSSINNDDARIIKFEKSWSEINLTFQKLKFSGKVKSFYCFPYTTNFAFKSKESKLFDGYTLYRNYYEKDYEKFISRLPNNSVIAIRPFYAGRGFVEGNNAHDMLKYNLKHKAIDKVVLTVTKKKHLNDLQSFFA